MSRTGTAPPSSDASPACNGSVLLPTPVSGTAAVPTFEGSSFMAMSLSVTVA